MEQRWTDIPMMPGIASSSSTLMFASKVLSRPVPTDCYLTFLRFEDILLAVSLLNRLMVDFRWLACRRLEARSKSDGLLAGFGGKAVAAAWLSVRLLFSPSLEMRPNPAVIEPGEKRCIVTTLSARMLIFRETFKSSSSSFRSVSSAVAKASSSSAISSSPRFSLFIAAASASAAASITCYCLWRIDFRSL